MEKITNYEDLSLRIAEAISPYRKRSERFVGMVPYSLHFEIRKYSGTSLKPEKVNILDKTIINLIGRGLSDLPTISKKLGFDYQYDLDRDILSSNIEYLKKNLQFIAGENRNLSLTPIGQKVYDTGEFVREIQSKFDLYVIPECPYFPALKDCLEGLSGVVKGKRETKNEDLSLEQIKFIAESQASHVQHTESNLKLINTNFQNYVEATIHVNICFLQNVLDNSVRTIIYDDSTQSVIPLMSSLFDGNIPLRDRLLKQCLKVEVADESAELIESGEKPQEQIQAEEIILQEVEEKGEEINVDEVEEKKVGSIFDSAEFEKELYDIFEKHENEEIWLISPWIRKYAFLRSREPQIRRFLDQGGTVFIGYSEPEKLGEEMVDRESMAVVKRLDANYDRFYYAELPKFHHKNVIEFKEKQATLYTGSFNVLSFCINESTEHYRMEQMMLANRDSATKIRTDYLRLFAKKYVNEYVVKMGVMKEGSTLKAPKLKYLDECEALIDSFPLLDEKAEEKSIKIDINAVSEITKEELMSIAQKIMTISYQDDAYYIQAALSADLFLYEEAKASSNANLLSTVEKHLFQIIQRKSIYNICRFILSKGIEDKKKSVIRIICNGVNYEFGEVFLPSNVFNIINKHKEYIDLRGSNIKPAKYNIKQLLYNSAKSLNY